jgi:hypothetical protein
MGYVLGVEGEIHAHILDIRGTVSYRVYGYLTLGVRHWVKSLSIKGEVQDIRVKVLGV